MKRDLLLIHKTQFGYLTDVYKWCEYLRHKYSITVVSLNQSYKQIPMSGIKVVDVCGTNYFIRGMKFLYVCLREIYKNKGSIIIQYFNEVSLLRRIFPKKKIVLDIRTLSVNPDCQVRDKENNKLKSELTKYFKLSVISEGVKRQLGENANGAIVVPLGAEPRYSDELRSKSAHLLYVGTLYNRRIEDTIIGLKIFVDRNQDSEILYDIVGDGPNGELDELKKLVRKFDLTQVVRFHGRIPNSELGFFLDKANIGISYIPMTQYYDYQPPTKTFEYVLSGLLCLATQTEANKEIVSNKNGVLINDNPNDFATGLERCCRLLSNTPPEQIRNSLKEYSWKNIVNQHLIKLIE